MATATMTEYQDTNHEQVRFPSSVTITDIRVPFGRALGICLKWGFAAFLTSLILGVAFVAGKAFLVALFLGT